MLNLLDRRTATAACLALVLGVAGCSDDDDPTGPGEPSEYRTVEVDASNGWAFLNLETGTVTNEQDFMLTTGWDMAFNGFSVMLNGGAAGPGNVAGACDCSDWTLEEIEDFTPQSELPRFEAASAATIPAASEFVQDELLPAVASWYAGEPGAAATPSENVTFIARRGDPASFVKFHVTAITGASATSPGEVTIEYAVQDGESFGALQSRTITVGEDPVFVDLYNGGGDATSWDLRFEGWTVRVNGGVSGSGVGAVEIEEPFAGIDLATARTIPASIYAGDSYGGIFAEYPWQIYSGPPLHQVFPTFDVYYIRRGDDVYKVQLTSYYSSAGVARHITVRFQLLDQGAG
jgi:hypothetical protein